MKKKLLLLAIMVMAIMCIFAISVSAESKIVKLDYDPGLDCDDSLVSILDGDYTPYTPTTWASVTGGLDTKARCVLTDGNGGYYAFPAWYIYRDEAYETNNPNNHNGYKHNLSYDRLNTAIAKYNTDNGTTYYAEYSRSGNNQLNLVRLDILNGVYEIDHGSQKFENSALLVEVTFPASIGLIDAQNALQGTKITKVDLSKTTITYLPNAFCQNLTTLTEIILPSTLTSLNNYVFNSCSSLSKINLEDTKVSYIGQNAFDYCTSLKNIKFPSQISSINACAFRGCTALEFVYFAESTAAKLEMSGWGTFVDCTSLKAISLPRTTTKIGDRCFNNCTSLTAVYLGESLIEIKGNQGNSHNAFNSKVMYFVQEPFSVLKEDGSFYSASEFTPPAKPDVYYFPSTLKSIVGSQNENAYLWLSDFRYVYTDSGEVDANNKPIYVLTLDEDGYPIIDKEGNGFPKVRQELFDKDGNKILNPVFYLFEYETNDDGSLVIEEFIEGNKVYRGPKVKRDADGNIVYRLDENGDKIPLYDNKGRLVQGMDENGIVLGAGQSDAAFYNCKNLNSVLVFPEGFTGFYDGTRTYDENQRGDNLGSGILMGCATAENPITLVFLGRIDRLSMDRKDGNTKYLTYVFANEANTGFENTKIATWYNGSDTSFRNQDEMYVIFCNAEGGAQKYKINFVADANNNTLPVLNPTLQTKAEGTDWHIYDPSNDDEITPATCITDAYGTLYCFCGAKIGTQTIEGTKTGVHIYDDDHDCTTADKCTLDANCTAETEILVHKIFETLEYESFLAKGEYCYGCSNAGCTVIDKASQPNAIFVAGEGFATKLNAADGISGGYVVNVKELKEYNRVNSDAPLIFGVMMVNPDYLDGKTSFFDANGKVNAIKYLQVDMSGTAYTNLSVSITGFNQANKDVSLVIALYAYTDLEDVEFIQSQTTKCANENVTIGGESLYTVTFTSVSEAAGKDLSDLGDYVMPSQKEQEA